MDGPGTGRRDLREVMRDEMVMHDRITALLKGGPKTVPELAEALGAPADEVMFWVMAMRRYGRVAETGKPDGDGFFQYAAAGGSRE